MLKSAFKIIKNDTDIAYELEIFRIDTRLFNICMGESVGGKTILSPEIQLYYMMFF